MATGIAGSTSDDGGAGSGGEMSESGKTKKLKLNPSRGGTPQGSRAGSPAPMAGRSFSGSRASSPEGTASMKGKFDLLLSWDSKFPNFPRSPPSESIYILYG